MEGDAPSAPRIACTGAAEPRMGLARTLALPGSAGASPYRASDNGRPPRAPAFWSAPAPAALWARGKLGGQGPPAGRVETARPTKRRRTAADRFPRWRITPETVSVQNLADITGPANSRRAHLGGRVSSRAHTPCIIPRQDAKTRDSRKQDPISWKEIRIRDGARGAPRHAEETR